MKYRFVGSFAVVFMLVGFLFGMTPTLSKAAENVEGFKVTSITGVLGFGTEPCCDLGMAFGLGVGADFYHLQLNDQDVEIRADLGYIKWSERKVDFRRIPLIFSGRWYISKQENVTFYAQGGLGLSFDKAEVGGGPFSSGSSDSEVNLDFVPAAGVRFHVSPLVSLGGELDIHLTDESYVTFLGTATFFLGN